MWLLGLMAVRTLGIEGLTSKHSANGHPYSLATTMVSCKDPIPAW